MTKNEFFETVKDGVIKILADDDPTIEGSITEVNKINGVVLTGLSFKSKESRISPVVYLDEFWDKYRDEDLPIEDVISKLASIYRNHENGCQNVNADDFTDYEKIKGRIVPALCNTEICTEYLKDCPSEALWDLSIYYRIMVDIADGEGSVLIKNQLMDSWGISYEELKDQAWKNIHKINPPSFISISDVLKDMMPTMDIPEQEGIMYVLTTQSRNGGAVYIADKNVLQNIADDMDMDLFILPSSRSEVIIVPYAIASTPDKWYEMLQMVTEINHNGTVSTEDFLADSCYCYLRSSGNLEKVA